MNAPHTTATTLPAERNTPAASPLWASAATLIRADHAAVLALYHKLRPSTPRSVREATLRRICLALEIHAQVEEEIFYPALRGHGLPAQPLDDSPAEHDRMRVGIERLRAAKDDEMRERSLHALMNDVMHHMADEETQLLPQAEAALGEEAMCELGARMFKRRMALSREHAGEMALDTVRAAPARSGLAAAALLGLAAWWLAARPRVRQILH